jgi:transcriptional regulator with XRE-family HTH domain
MQQTFSEQMREKRKKLGMTQQELADSSGVGRLLINQIENNKAKNVRENTLRDISKALGMLEVGQMVASPRATSQVVSPDLAQRVQELEKELARERAWTEKLWQENQELKGERSGKKLASPEAADAHNAPMWVAA